MNLRLHKGKVPILSSGKDTIHLVDFPSWEDFSVMYSKYVSAAKLARNYDILRDRASGLTLAEIKDKHFVSRERARQIEAKFLRLMQRAHSSKTD